MRIIEQFYKAYYQWRHIKYRTIIINNKKYYIRADHCEDIIWQNDYQ